MFGGFAHLLGVLSTGEFVVIVLIHSLARRTYGLQPTPQRGTLGNSPYEGYPLRRVQ